MGLLQYPLLCRSFCPSGELSTSWLGCATGTPTRLSCSTLLNLAHTFQAAYAAPIIMMSQNRLAAKDRLMAEQDYQVNTKAEEEVKGIMQYLEQQDEVMIDILRRMEQQDLSMTNAFAAIRSNGDRNPRPA
jgi:uncharacterized protein DUF1003